MSAHRPGLATLLGVAFSFGGGIGCATGPSPMERLRDRAAFDLKCAQDTVRVKYVEVDVGAAAGCGQQATSIAFCNEYNTCTWVMDGAPRTDTDQRTDPRGSLQTNLHETAQ